MTTCNISGLYCVSGPPRLGELCSISGSKKSMISGNFFPSSQINDLFLASVTGNDTIKFDLVGNPKDNPKGNLGILETEKIKETKSISGLVNKFVALDNVTSTINGRAVNFSKSYRLGLCGNDKKAQLLHITAAAKMPTISGRKRKKRTKETENHYPKSKNISGIKLKNSDLSKYISDCSGQEMKKCVYKKLRKNTVTTNLGKMMLSVVYNSENDKNKKCSFHKHVLHSLSKPLHSTDNLLHDVFSGKCEDFNWTCKNLSGSYYTIKSTSDARGTKSMYNRTKKYLTSDKSKTSESCRIWAQEIAELYKTAKQFEGFNPYDISGSTISGCDVIKARENQIMPTAYAAFKARNKVQDLECVNQGKLKSFQKETLASVCKTCELPFDLLQYEKSSKSYSSRSPIGQCNQVFRKTDEYSFNKSNKSNKKSTFQDFCRDMNKTKLNKHKTANDKNEPDTAKKLKKWTIQKKNKCSGIHGGGWNPS